MRMYLDTMAFSPKEFPTDVLRILFGQFSQIFASTTSAAVRRRAPRRRSRRPSRWRRTSPRRTGTSRSSSRRAVTSTTRRRTCGISSRRRATASIRGARRPGAGSLRSRTRSASHGRDRAQRRSLASRRSIRGFGSKSIRRCSPASATISTPSCVISRKRETTRRRTSASFPRSRPPSPSTAALRTTGRTGTASRSEPSGSSTGA